LAPSALRFTVAVIWSSAAAAFFQTGGLLFGAARQVVGRAGDFAHPAPQTRHGPQRLPHRLAQAFDRRIIVVAHPHMVALHRRIDPRGQVAGRQLVQHPRQGVDQQGLGAFRLDPFGLAARGLLLVGGDVDGQFDDLHRPPVGAEHRIVGRLQPHLAAALGQAAELARQELAGVQLAPEGGVVGRGRLGRVHEGPVMGAPDLVQTIAHRGQKVLVGVDDGAVQVELDHRLRPADGGHLAVQIDQAILHVR
jgi:hypothetical protein